MKRKRLQVSLYSSCFIASVRWNVENFFSQNCNIFSVLSTVSNITQKAKQITNLLLLSNNFYSMISYRRDEKENDELLYCVWSLVMVRESVVSARG